MSTRRSQHAKWCCFLPMTQISSPAYTFYLTYPRYGLEHSLYWKLECTSETTTVFLASAIIKVDPDGYRLWRAAEIFLLRDLNALYTDCLISSKTNHAVRSVHEFTLTYGLTQQFTTLTWFPRCSVPEFFVVGLFADFSSGQLPRTRKFPTWHPQIIALSGVQCLSHDHRDCELHAAVVCRTTSQQIEMGCGPFLCLTLGDSCVSRQIIPTPLLILLLMLCCRIWSL